MLNCAEQVQIQKYKTHAYMTLKTAGVQTTMLKHSTKQLKKIVPCPVSFPSILLYSILGCVLPLQEAALCQSPPSFSVLCYPCPYRSLLPHSVISPTTFGLPTDLTPSVCHSVLLIVHLLSFIRVMCPAHFHFVLVTYWTMSSTLVLCLMMVLRILSFSLTLSILLSIARWLVSSFFSNAFVRDHVWHQYVIAGKTHQLKTFCFLLFPSLFYTCNM